jgi:hypothetical protein
MKLRDFGRKVSLGGAGVHANCRSTRPFHQTRRTIRSKARPALLWMLFFFLVGHLAVGRYLHRRHPEFFDPEVSMRLRRLPARLAEAPGRPLALAIGSSRIEMGLRPQSVMEQVKDVPNQALLFNFSMLGAGPVGQRLIVHRLLQKGIHPKWVFVEVWAPILTQKYPLIEEMRTFCRDVYWSDVRIVAGLYHRGWEAFGRAFTATLTPLLEYRNIVLRHYAPSLLHPLVRLELDGGFQRDLLYHLDDFGWVEFNIHPHSKHAEGVRIQYKPLFDNFFIDDVANRAMHDLLEECRAHNIQVIFLLMPEHSLMRGWYPLIQDRLIPYLRRLSAENHAPIVDARAWQPDEDIPDCSHMSAKGARSFSERFGREVYRPLLRGRPLSPDILLRDP